MSCNRCADQAQAAMAAAGVPARQTQATWAGQGDRPRCAGCGAWTGAGGQCRNPRCGAATADWGEMEKRQLARQLGHWIGVRLDGLREARSFSRAEGRAVGQMLKELRLLRSAAAMFQDNTPAFAVYAKGTAVMSRRRAKQMREQKRRPRLAEVEDLFAEALEAYHEAHRPTPEETARILGSEIDEDWNPVPPSAPDLHVFDEAEQTYRTWEGSPPAARRSSSPRRRTGPGRGAGRMVLWRAKRPRGATVFSISTAGMSHEGRSDYVAGMTKNGGDVLVSSDSLDWSEAELRQAYERSTHVLIPGGADIHPSFYGQDEHPRLGYTRPGRDRAEYLLTKWALEDGKPIMGICRGHQMITVAAGGTLYQDIPSQIGEHVSHGANYHEITIVPDSRLAEMLGTDRIRVNSLHHQATDEVPPGWRAVAWSEDGVIEAIEHPTLPAISVQFHPERLRRRDKRFNRLFDQFTRM